MQARTKSSILFSAVLALGATSAFATGPNGGQPVTQADILISNGGDVTTQIIPFNFGGGPGYHNDLYSMPTGSLSGSTYIGQNYDWVAGSTAVDLGTISAGHEVELGMKTNVWGGNPQGYDNLFVTGAGSRNPDGEVHAVVSSMTLNNVSGYRVDFEDLPKGGSDWNYGDASVFVTGVHTQAVPEPTSIAALGIGALGLIRRRFKK